MTCMDPEGCLYGARLRGLCSKHYQRRIKQVSARLTTWTELRKAGAALAPAKLSAQARFGGRSAR